MLFRRVLVSFIALCSVSSSVGCAAGYNRDLMAANMKREGLQITDSEIQASAKLKPQLPSPFSLGVWVNGGLRFRKQVKDQLQPIGDRLVRDRVVSSVAFLVPSNGGWSSTRADIRREAALAGVDAVLVIDKQDQTDRYENPLSFLYLTVVGMFLVPASHADTLAEVRGAIIDTNNGFLYAMSSGEGEAKSMRPLALLDSDDSRREALKKAVDDLGHDIEGRVRNVALEVARAAVPAKPKQP